MGRPNRCAGRWWDTDHADVRSTRPGSVRESLTATFPPSGAPGMPTAKTAASLQSGSAGELPFPDLANEPPVAGYLTAGSLA